jgi:hypothetical protein
MERGKIVTHYKQPRGTGDQRLQFASIEHREIRRLAANCCEQTWNRARIEASPPKICGAYDPQLKAQREPAQSALSGTGTSMEGAYPATVPVVDPGHQTPNR